jgi:hypothetical protein
MSLSTSQLIGLIDRIDETRDLNHVALMAAGDLGDRQDSGGLVRLLGIVASQLQSVRDDLEKHQMQEAADAS